MKKEIKVCIPDYKMAYSILFAVLLCLVRGIGNITDIGVALDTSAPLLAIIFCGDTFWMEYMDKRWEIFRLYSMKKKRKLIYRRIAVQAVYLCLVFYAGYWMFYWQKPRNIYHISSAYLYGIYCVAVAVTILFWGVLSMTLVNLFRNLWAGIGASVILWLTINSSAGDRVLGKYSIFAFSFRDVRETGNFDWLWGKGIALLAVAFMLVMVPAILKKRG